MIPGEELEFISFERVPRVGGGDPPTKRKTKSGMKCSPRRRG